MEVKSEGVIQTGLEHNLEIFLAARASMLEKKRGTRRQTESFIALQICEFSDKLSV